MRLVGAAWCLSLAATTMAARANLLVDVTEDGGVRKRLLQAGTGLRPEKGMVAKVAYTAMLGEGGSVIRDAAGETLVCGDAGNMRGLDAAVATMAVGERSEFEVRFDYAYGEAGLAGVAPPRADLFYVCELLGVQAAGSEGDDGAPLALPDAAANRDDAGGGGVRTVEVDGRPVKLDALGPMVVNKDGTLSRITNWPEMHEVERERTLRVIAKRNEKRLADLRAADL